MPTFNLPNSASIHTARSFLAGSDFFGDSSEIANLTFHPTWVHMEPIALAMAAAWGSWCDREGYEVRLENVGRHAAYAGRMGLYRALGIDYDPGLEEHEEAGRFLPITNVRDKGDIRSVIGDISAQLHLDNDPDTLAAVQYCITELLRNVLEHSGSPDGAFVCSQNYDQTDVTRVTLAVADCGIGLATHLGQVYPEALESDQEAIALALQPGITGALPGMYGTPDNAGAGLFITRCIAKGTGGYFLIASGSAGYRLRRARTNDDQMELDIDPLGERHDLWELPNNWKGTVATIEIRTDRIADFEGYFGWIKKQVPSRTTPKHEIKFT